MSKLESKKIHNIKYLVLNFFYNFKYLAQWILKNINILASVVPFGKKLEISIFQNLEIYHFPFLSKSYGIHIKKYPKDYFTFLGYTFNVKNKTIVVQRKC